MPSCPVRSEPWLVESAIAFLAGFLKPHHSVLEFGGGASTVWFARRCRHVVTFETEANYITVIRSLIGHRTDLRLTTPERIVEEPKHFLDESFDLVLVDTGLERERQGCAVESVRLVRPGGVLMADNPGWLDLPALHALMPDWNYVYAAQRHPDKFGFPDVPTGWETAWWQRPDAGPQTPGEMYEGYY